MDGVSLSVGGRGNMHDNNTETRHCTSYIPNILLENVSATN